MKTMRVLTIVGKVDSRILAYTLSRALSLIGRTALISDDGAYKRLYHGNKLKGVVSGVDVGVGYKVDEKLRKGIGSMGADYDYMVVVSTDYIPEYTTGVVLCKGVDRSILAEGDRYNIKEEDRRELQKDGGGRKGKKRALEEVGDVEDKDCNTNDGIEDSKDRIEAREEDKDDIEIPEGIPSNSVIISFHPTVRKGSNSIGLRDSIIRYVYDCEERKELLVFRDKKFNKMLADIGSKPLGMDVEELYKLLCREEYISGGKVK